jgi:hypothetical protein
MIGDTVWAKFGDHGLRLGKIEEKKMCNNWAYVRVNWVSDTAMEMDRARVMELRGYDKYSDWYRIDKVSFFDKEKLVTIINKL